MLTMFRNYCNEQDCRTAVKRAACGAVSGSSIGFFGGIAAKANNFAVPAAIGFFVGGIVGAVSVPICRAFTVCLRRYRNQERQNYRELHIQNRDNDRLGV